MHVAFIVHYFPPLNSTGARRVLAFAKYLHRFGHRISVVTTQKHTYDGYLTEALPPIARCCNSAGPPPRGRPPARTLRRVPPVGGAASPPGSSTLAAH